MDVTVLLATRDRAALLDHTLSLLAQQRCKGFSWELVVVDNGSSDDTPRVLESHAAKLPLRALLEPTAGKNRAMNRGLDEAKGSLIVFTDDDVEPSGFWLSHLWRAACAQPSHAVFAGPVKPDYPEGTPAWLVNDAFVASWMYTRFLWGAVEDELPVHVLPAGPNFAVRASALAGTRFDVDIGPDGSATYAMGSETELLQRLKGRGERAWYVPTAMVRHHIDARQTQAAWLLKRSFRVGRCLARLFPDDAPRWLGAPAYLWWWLPLAWLRAKRSSHGDEHARILAAMQYEVVRGLVQEERAMGASRGRPGSRDDHRAMRQRMAGMGEGERLMRGIPLS